MNKSVKPVIVYSLILFIVLAVFLLGFTGIKLKCDQLTKDIVKKEDSIINKRNRQVYLLARLQYYTSEDRITEIAINELNMMKRTDPRIVLEVNKEKIEAIENALKDKYD